MKNTLHINVYDRFGETLNTRVSATNLLELVRIFRGDIVNLDFHNVVFMSRSFADQFHKERVKLQIDNDILFEISNASDDIRKMLTIVASTQEKKERHYRVLPIFNFTKEESLEEYLLTI